MLKNTCESQVVITLFLSKKRNKSDNFEDIGNSYAQTQELNKAFLMMCLWLESTNSGLS